jgi:hypothetical protein
VPKSFDWTFHNDYPEVDCYCACGAVFKSHMTVRRKLRAIGGSRDGMRPGFEIITRTPCPRCSARHRVIRGERDPKDFDIRER